MRASSIKADRLVWDRAECTILKILTSRLAIPDDRSRRSSTAHKRLGCFSWGRAERSYAKCVHEGSQIFKDLARHIYLY